MGKGTAALAAMVILAQTVAAHAVEWEVHPSIVVNEEYTDNVNEARDHRVSDFITRAMPGIGFTYKAPALDGEVSYTYDYRYYVKGKSKESRSNESTHVIAVRNHLTAVDNLLFIDLNDDYRRVSLDVTRDNTKESLFVNQADRNLATISPYFILRPSERTSLKTGYAFIDTRYFDSTVPSRIGPNTSGITTPPVDKMTHNGFLDGSYEFSPSWSATSGYSFTHEEAHDAVTANQAFTDYNRHQAYAGFRYEYANASFLFAQLGNTWIFYDNGNDLSNLFWNVGFTHNFDTATATLTTGVRYDEDPRRNISQETFVNGTARKLIDNGSMELSLYYSEFVITEFDVLQTRKWGGIASGIYNFTSFLTGNISFTAEKYDQNPLPNDQITISGWTRRLVADARLTYVLKENMSVALNYIYADYYSPQINNNNSQVNRAILEFRATF